MTIVPKCWDDVRSATRSRRRMAEVRAVEATHVRNSARRSPASRSTTSRPIQLLLLTDDSDPMVQ